VPNIVNVYTDPNVSLGKSLEQLGQSVWGPQAAAAEYAKQRARGALRNNQSIEALQQAERNGGANMSDPNTRANIIGLENPRNYGQGQLVIQSGRYGAASPQAASAAVGAGEGYGSTAQGVREGYENQRVINDMTTRRQQASQQYQFDNTFEKVADPRDPTREILVPRSQAAGRQTPVTKETIVAGALNRALPGGSPAPQGVPYQTAGMPSASTATSPLQGASPDPFINVPPSLRGAAGVSVPQQSMINARTGETGVSRDGGYTVDLPNGQRVNASGFNAAPQDAALAQSRSNAAREEASQPLVASDPMKGEAAAAAYNATGALPWLAHHANATIGSIPGVPYLIDAVGGTGGEILPGVQQANRVLENKTQQVRGLLAHAFSDTEGRIGVQDRKWIDELLPEGGLGNPSSAVREIPTTVEGLKQRYALLQSQVTAATPPQVIDRVSQQLRAIKMAAEILTAPQQGAQPQAAQTPAAAPQQQAQQAQGNDPISQARNAIAQGVPKAAVIQRLQQNGIQPPPDL
jgi:hypothetical protein